MTRGRSRYTVSDTSIIFLLTVFLPVFAAQANPLLQLISRAAPPQRVVILLNYFDSSRVVAQHKTTAFRILDTVEDFARIQQDESLRQYGRFLRNTYEKNNNALTNRQKAELFLTAGRQAVRDGNDQIQGVCQHFAGLYYFLSEDYGKAFEYLVAANGTFQRIGYQHVPGINRYLYELGFSYYYFKEYGKAIRLLQEAIRYPAFNENFRVQTPNTLALCYLRINQLGKPADARQAERYFKKALAIARAQQSVFWTGNIYGNLAKIYLHQKRVSEAINALRFDYTIALNANNKGLLPDQASLSLARAYLMRRQPDSCLYFLTRSKLLYQRNISPGPATFGSNLGDENYLRNYCDVARQYYLAVNDPVQAYRYLDSMSVLDQRINKRYNSDQISLVEQRLLIQKHQTEVAALEADRRQQRLRFGVAATVLILIAALFWRLYQLSRLKNRQEAAINAEREKSWRLEKQLVEEELQRAHKDLAVFMDNLRERHALIEAITDSLQDQNPGPETGSGVASGSSLLRQLFTTPLLTNEDWDEFRRRFERVYPAFFPMLRARFTALTPAEERFLALTKLNIDTRQMGHILGISPASVRTTRYRLRKRLGAGEQTDLDDLLNQ